MVRRLVVAGVFAVVGFVARDTWDGFTARAEGHGRGGAVPVGNGDVNADGDIDISDGIYILSFLFTGGPAPHAIASTPCGGGALPATGQAGCYDLDLQEIPCGDPAFPGQDGAYQAGCPSAERFVDHGDGTVTDSCTGLMWQKETADVNEDGRIGDEDAVSWQGALKYCDALDFAGHDDWRLPNVRELQSLVDYGRYAPAISPVFGLEAGYEVYWSASCDLHTAPTGYAWYVSFLGGVVQVLDGEWPSGVVRAVRNAPQAP